MLTRNKAGNHELDSYIDINPDIFYVHNLEGKLIKWNRALEDFTGLGSEELMYKPAIEFIFEEDRKAVQVAIQKVFDTGYGSVEARFIRKDGTLIPYLCNGTVLRDEQGEIVGFTGTGRDISDRKQLEEEREKVFAWQKQINGLQENLLGEGGLSEKLKLITDSVVEIFHADFCRIWIIKPGDLCNSGCNHIDRSNGPDMCHSQDRCLHLAASSGRYTHIDGGHSRVPWGCYKIGKLAAGHDSKLISNNVTQDPNVHDHKWAGELGLKSFAGYQLRNAKGETVGALALFSKNRIEKEEDVLLESLGNSTAQVIQTKIALSKVKLLSGLLPICSSCKKVRDDSGYWNQIESYIRDHSEAEFSHGLCPDCMKGFYDELNKNMNS